MRLILWKQSEEYPALVTPPPSVVGESSGAFLVLGKPARNRVTLWTSDDVLVGGVAPLPVVGESHGAFLFLGKPKRGTTTLWMTDDAFAVAIAGVTSFVNWISTDMD